MHTTPSEDFQKKVAALIVRNSNVLDILTKCQTSCAKLYRSTVKSATGCGCTKIIAEKSLTALENTADFSPKDMAGITGALCNDCKSSIQNEIGETLFYIASLCNALGVSMNDIMQREIKNVEALGKYSLR